MLLTVAHFKLAFCSYISYIFFLSHTHTHTLYPPHTHTVLVNTSLSQHVLHLQQLQTLRCLICELTPKMIVRRDGAQNQTCGDSARDDGCLCVRSNPPVNRAEQVAWMTYVWTTQSKKALLRVVLHESCAVKAGWHQSVWEKETGRQTATERDLSKFARFFSTIQQAVVFQVLLFCPVGVAYQLLALRVCGCASVCNDCAV